MLLRNAFFLLALVTAAALAGSSSSSSEETKIKNKRGKCVEVIERPSKGDCILIESLKSFIATIEVEVAVKAQFEALINTINTKIILNEALQPLEVFVQASYRLKAFLLRYAVLQTQIEYLAIGEWGLVNDLFVISVQIKGETAESVIVEDSGDCELVVALLKLGDFLADEVKEALDELIAELRLIVKESLDYAKKMSKCGKLFKKYIKLYPALAIVKSTKIGAWGVFNEFFDVSEQYERIEKLPELCKRGEGNTIQVILDLEKSLTDVSFKWTKAERFMLRTFFGNLKFLTIDAALTEAQIMKIVSTQFLEFVKINAAFRARLRNVKIGDFGGFGAFIDVFVYVALESVDWSTSPPPVSVTPGPSVSGATESGSTVSGGTASTVTAVSGEPSSEGPSASGPTVSAEPSSEGPSVSGEPSTELPVVSGSTEASSDAPSSPGPSEGSSVEPSGTPGVSPELPSTEGGTEAFSDAPSSPGPSEGSSVEPSGSPGVSPELSSTEPSFSSTGLYEPSTPEVLKGDCSKKDDLIVVPPGGNANQTTLIISYYAAAATWTDVVQTSNFYTFVYQISTFIIVNSEYPTADAKMVKIVAALEEYMAVSETRRKLVSEIKIDGWGTNEQLCGCPK